MSALILTALCVAGLFAMGVVLLREGRDKEAEQQPEQHRKTTTEPPRTATPDSAAYVVSERRIVQESRKMIEEIEHFLSDHQSS